MDSLDNKIVAWKCLKSAAKVTKLNLNFVFGKKLDIDMCRITLICTSKFNKHKCDCHHLFLFNLTILMDALILVNCFIL